MNSQRLIFKDGVIITSNDTFRGSLIVENERITGIIKDYEFYDGDEVVDVQGKFLLPGVIDVHTDFDAVSAKQKSLESFSSGSKSAISGGITTIIDHCLQKKGETLTQSLNRKINGIKENSFCDYSFHAVITKMGKDTLDQMFEMVNAGVPSFKFYLASNEPSLITNDYYLFSALNEAQKYGAIVGIHAENSSIIKYLTDKFKNENKISPDYHFKASPNFAEYECINKALIFNEVSGSNLYIFSLSTKEGLIPVILSRGMGMRVYSETNLHYLIFDNSRYYDENGEDYIVSPPLRSEEDCNSLWDGIKMGNIDVVSSAHRVFEKNSLKSRPFYEIPSGIGGNEYLLPVMYTEGVLNGRITLNKMVSVLSFNPAKIMGLYPEKGDIQIGAHADIVIFDPEEQWSAEKSFSKTQSSVYKGMPLMGKVKKTFVRGREVFSDGRFTEKKGIGQYIKRVPQE